MKRLLMMVAVTIFLMACNKDEEVQTLSEGGALCLQINIDSRATKAIEAGHTGNDKISPKVYSASVLAYNSGGVVIQQVDLEGAELNKAIIGSYTDSNGATQTGGANLSAGAGAIVGLPSGTVRVDVVLNNPKSKNTDLSANINYFNSKTKTAESTDYFSDNNFDRVFLVTDYYGSGVPVSSFTVGDNKNYRYNFEVAPATARFEVTGGINVSSETVYKDKWQRKWAKVGAKELIEFMMSSSANEFGVNDMAIVTTDDSVQVIQRGIISTTFFKYDIRADKRGDPADGKEYTRYTYYFPQVYWHIKEGETTQPSKGIGDNGTTDIVTGDVTGWIKSPLWPLVNESAGSVKSLTWYPNGYCAVNVEEVFINNIKVIGPDKQNYLAQWPGEKDGDNGWPNWYKSYHIDGWHSAGTSASNKFLCLGNMWDRIIKEDGGSWTSVNWGALSIPSIDGTGMLVMKTLKSGIASPDPDKAEYLDQTSSPQPRNIGIKSGKAAAYHFYAQTATSGSISKDALSTQLPHIVLKLKCYETKEDLTASKMAPGKEFITIKVFSGTSGNIDYITDFKRGCIYRLNLNDLLPSFVGKAPIPTTGADDNAIVTPIDPVDPQPEMPNVNLTVGVTVLQWTPQNVYPVI